MKTLPFVFLLLLSGCCLFETVPPGKAPEGAIVNNTLRKTFDVRSAVNYMTTSLSIHLLTNPLPENFAALDSDEETSSYARMVLEELRSITGISERNAPARAVLRTRSTENGWHFILLLDGKSVWQEHLDTLYNTEKKGSSAK